ncbi:paraneoplastic antigen-like protein 5 [Phocoena sinus]|uniref:paraneoplastic antigen-like protein 5 n=1 Tax=Phocoena sinus TaxID=42100 RepID=UPI0013C4969E|nr:paraneoplastic antigen-like protein 5 [Phocoena sinus]
MGPQATRGLEAPPPGPPLSEGAGAGAGVEGLWRREEMPRRDTAGSNFRIIYTARGEPREGSTLEPLRRFVHGHWSPGTGLENHSSPAANAKASPKACHLGAALSGRPRPR